MKTSSISASQQRLQFVFVLNFFPEILFLKFSPVLCWSSFLFHVSFLFNYLYKTSSFNLMRNFLCTTSRLAHFKTKCRWFFPTENIQSLSMRRYTHSARRLFTSLLQRTDNSRGKGKPEKVCSRGNIHCLCWMKAKQSPCPA